jgi:hypothetical protein
VPAAGTGSRARPGDLVPRSIFGSDRRRSTPSHTCRHRRIRRSWPTATPRESNARSLRRRTHARASCSHTRLSSARWRRRSECTMARERTTAENTANERTGESHALGPGWQDWWSVDKRRVGGLAGYRACAVVLCARQLGPRRTRKQRASATGARGREQGARLARLLHASGAPANFVCTSERRQQCRAERQRSRRTAICRAGRGARMRADAQAPTKTSDARTARTSPARERVERMTRRRVCRRHEARSARSAMSCRCCRRRRRSRRTNAAGGTGALEARVSVVGQRRRTRGGSGFARVCRTCEWGGKAAVRARGYEAVRRNREDGSCRAHLFLSTLRAMTRALRAEHTAVASHFSGHQTHARLDADESREKRRRRYFQQWKWNAEHRRRHA